MAALRVLQNMTTWSNVNLESHNALLLTYSGFLDTTKSGAMIKQMTLEDRKRGSHL